MENKLLLKDRGLSADVIRQMEYTNCPQQFTVLMTGCLCCTWHSAG
jgi:hypothetical protein